jgi:hypothetical protein
VRNERAVQKARADGRVGWNFVYTYHPIYEAVLDAHRRQPTMPAVLGEANYERENNQPETSPTTDERPFAGRCSGR